MKKRNIWKIIMLGTLGTVFVGATSCSPINDFINKTVGKIFGEDDHRVSPRQNELDNPKQGNEGDKVNNAPDNNPADNDNQASPNNHTENQGNNSTSIRDDNSNDVSENDNNNNLKKDKVDESPQNPPKQNNNRDKNTLFNIKNVDILTEDERKLLESIHYWNENVNKPVNDLKVEVNLIKKLKNNDLKIASNTDLLADNAPQGINQNDDSIYYVKDYKDLENYHNDDESVGQLSGKKYDIWADFSLTKHSNWLANRNMMKNLLKLSFLHTHAFRTDEEKRKLLELSYIDNLKDPDYDNNTYKDPNLPDFNIDDNNGYSYMDIINNKNHLLEKIYNSFVKDNKVYPLVSTHMNDLNINNLNYYFGDWNNILNPYEIKDNEFISWNIKTATTLGEKSLLDTKEENYIPYLPETALQKDIWTHYRFYKTIGYSSILSINDENYATFDDVANKSSNGLFHYNRGSGTVISVDLKQDKDGSYCDSKLLYATNGHVINGIFKSQDNYNETKGKKIVYLSLGSSSNSYFLPFEVVSSSYYEGEISQNSEIHYMELKPRYDKMGSLESLDWLRRSNWATKEQDYRQETRKGFDIFFRNLEYRFGLTNTIAINKVNYETILDNSKKYWNISANHSKYYNQNQRYTLESDNEIVNMWKGVNDYSLSFLNEDFKNDPVKQLENLEFQWINYGKTIDLITRIVSEKANKLVIEENDAHEMAQALKDYLYQIKTLRRLVGFRINDFKEYDNTIPYHSQITVIPGSSGSGVYDNKGLVGLAFATTTWPKNLEISNDSSTIGNSSSREMLVRKGAWVSNTEVLMPKIFSWEYTKLLNIKALNLNAEGKVDDFADSTINWENLGIKKDDKDYDYKKKVILRLLNNMKLYTKEELLEIYAKIHNIN